MPYMLNNYVHTITNTKPDPIHEFVNRLKLCCNELKQRVAYGSYMYSIYNEKSRTRRKLIRPTHQSLITIKGRNDNIIKNATCYAITLALRADELYCS